MTFKDIFERATEMYKAQGLELIEKEKGWFNLENLQLGLKRTLDELCSYQVFFKGFSLKCPRCSSEFWYPIIEVRDAVNCRGCLQDFILPVEPQFAYKLNDLIRNNIYQTRTNRDGNLTVIKTLSVISSGSREAFQYSPQLNLYDDHHSNKPWGDLDIVCTDQGRFMIGEAKYNSVAFTDDSSKALRALVDIAKQIYPDEILLACSTDQNGKLEKAKKGLEHLFNGWPYQPVITTSILSEPDYWHIKSHRYFVY